MSARFDASTTLIPPTRTENRLPVPEFEPASIFTEEPRLRFEPVTELERLRPLLIDYDPRNEPAQYYQPPRNYGVLLAKFVGYSLLGAITIGLGLMIIAPFIAVGGC